MSSLCHFLPRYSDKVEHQGLTEVLLVFASFVGDLVSGLTTEMGKGMYAVFIH